MPRCAHLENCITHPAWHLCLRLSEHLQIAVIDTRGETLNQIIIDIRLAGMGQHLQHSIGAGKSAIKDWCARSLQSNRAICNLLDARWPACRIACLCRNLGGEPETIGSLRSGSDNRHFAGLTVDLPVHYEDRLVAMISADAQATRLAYADAWSSSADSFPISLAMPIRSEPYDGDQVLPWLMNLLPEGEPLRAMTRALGAAPEDALGLIAQTGNDLAGALSIAPQPPRSQPGYRPIPDADALERIIEELPARPFLVGEDGVSMSLAGAQEKLPVAIIDGQIPVPINGAPSTHILKPDNPRLPGSVQNEALCMFSPAASASLSRR